MTQSVRPTTGDAQVRINTGKDWNEWTALLDEWGGAKKGFTAIKHHLIQQYALSPFWAQMIAVDYKWTHWRFSDGLQPAFISQKITVKSNLIVKQ